MPTGSILICGCNTNITTQSRMYTSAAGRRTHSSNWIKIAIMARGYSLGSHVLRLSVKMGRPYPLGV